jgi:predicted RNA binding protein YcfA (HicA-like mRNA interferase family)
MSQWPAIKANRLLAVLLKIGWSVKGQVILIMFLLFMTM